MKDELELEYARQKSEDKSQRNEYDRHIEHLPLTELQINQRAVHKNPDVEEEFFKNEGEKKILEEIWKLPNPQNRRVYMHIVKEFSFAKIARIEHVDRSAVKRSVDSGIKKLQEKLKKIYFGINK